MVKRINSVIKESAAEKDLYDDLYSYADRNWATSRWTKSNVEKYLKRQQDFRRMNDSDFYKVISKVNKAFKKDRKIKSDPYCDSSYKNESMNTGRRTRRMNESNGAINDLEFYVAQIHDLADELARFSEEAANVVNGFQDIEDDPGELEGTENELKDFVRELRVFDEVYRNYIGQMSEWVDNALL